MANRRGVPPYTARGRVEGEDWQAVADAVNERMAALRLGQQALADASGVSVATLRQLQHGARGRRIQNATLTAVSRALDWPDDHLIRVLVGNAASQQEPADTAADIAGTERQILAVLLRIEERLTDLAERIVPGVSRGRQDDDGNGPRPAK